MKRAVGLLIALALPLAACGSDDDSSTSTAAVTDAPAGDGSTTTPDGTAPATTTAGATAASGGHATTAADGSITITHRHGTTTLDKKPERIVSVDLQWTDVLVALDAPLVGAPLDPLMESRGGRYPWQDDAIPADVTGIPIDASSMQLPFEAIAALQPDLIVVTWPAEEKADYERLREIAPTIPLLGERQVDLWTDIAQVAGELIGAPEKADALLAESEASVAALAAELPGLAGKNYALANYVAGSGITIVVDPDDGAAQVFAELGMQIDPELLAIDEGATGRVEISLERIDELDSDLLIMLTNGADPDEIPGYSALPAVKSGAVSLLGMAEVVGINTPTPLSLPFSLDAIRPALEAAAG